MIAQVAKGNGISRFVFASSCSVYGAGDQILNERSSLNPVSLYARSKIASENVLLSFRGGGFEPVILRFGTFMDCPGGQDSISWSIFWPRRPSSTKSLRYMEETSGVPFCMCMMPGRAVLAALDARSEAVEPVIFNVGCDEQNKTLGQVGELIQAMVPGSVLRCTEENVDRRNYRVEFRRIREAIGFHPVWKIEAGVQQVLDAIRSGKVTDYQDSKYSNVKFLSEPDGREQLPVMEDW